MQNIYSYLSTNVLSYPYSKAHTVNMTHFRRIASIYIVIGAAGADS